MLSRYQTLSSIYDNIRLLIFLIVTNTVSLNIEQTKLSALTVSHIFLLSQFLHEKLLSHFSFNFWYHMQIIVAHLETLRNISLLSCNLTTLVLKEFFDIKVAVIKDISSAINHIESLFDFVLWSSILWKYRCDRLIIHLRIRRR